jgi:hypothetical protein
MDGSEQSEQSAQSSQKEAEPAAASEQLDEKPLYEEMEVL